MARILLTGGAGYIGSHTCVALHEAGHEAVILDDFSNADESVVERIGRIIGAPPPVVNGSILDGEAVRRAFAEHAIDGVIHFAAFKAVGESVANPLAYFENNIAGSIALARAMREAQVWPLVFSSTATVYGEPDAFPIPETAPTGYTSPYAFTKITVEQILAQAAAADPFVIGALRYFNPVGAHESALIGEDPRGIPDNLMPYMAKVAMGELEQLSVFGDDYDTPDGTGLRDYIHVMDLAEAHVLSMNALLEGRAHTLNIGTGIPTSVLQMHEAYSRAVGRELPMRVVPRRPGDVPRLDADPARALEVLGFEAKRDLDAMCRDSWRWVRAQAAGWRLNDPS
ncbi:UDP-glucose 4-epimerase GalE [Jannaschia aquimarina]|uniref:UDP-glucose 4-epimerase n=1 Tax=Jannaschia aquimarina TaxID=935700 RepID=A0A0D1ENI1_9RHOB|nr:UDP-glucose 4-epimerase GalE [Jannaschia aquimarina]KIT17225.1 UDP-glucose 4-epimerase [Jannaschia aquimarina]SNT18724.1 UDP-glucose 4-epimerase [Jannaschia aquimarina]